MFGTTSISNLPPANHRMPFLTFPERPQQNPAKTQQERAVVPAGSSAESCCSSSLTLTSLFVA